MHLLIPTFCTLLITCATLVVQSANPVYSVLYLILAFFNASALVLLSGHDYMAALFIVLYVGAMCTFFLFAIMILDIKVEQVSEKRLKQTPVNAIIAAIFALQCKNLLHDFHSPIPFHTLIVEPLTPNLLDYTIQIYSLGAVLYTTFAWHLIVASLILLSAMLGSVALTLTKNIDPGGWEPTSNPKVQQIYKQNLRDFRLSITKNQ
jgi:NADH-quinone oxidoreductase subunit J